MHILFSLKLYRIKMIKSQKLGMYLQTRLYVLKTCAALLSWKQTSHLQPGEICVSVLLNVIPEKKYKILTGIHLNRM